MDKHWHPLYRVCQPIDFGEYNIQPLKNYPATGDVEIQGWQQIWGPEIWKKISMVNPRYVFINKD